MKVKWLDLKKQWEDAYPKMSPSPETILSTGQYIGGQHVDAFEKEFVDYCCKYNPSIVTSAIGTSSGTAALTACFEGILDFVDRASKCGVNSLTVVLPANTFVATANAAQRLSHRLVRLAFVDCGEDFQMCPLDLKQALRRVDSGVVIVVPVHMYGIMGDMRKIDGILDADERRDDANTLWMVEDASHAHGAIDHSGVRAGCWGELAAFSCFPAKPLGAAGDAGVILSNYEPVNDFIRSYCNVGRGSGWDDYDRVGYTYRLDTLQAVVLSAKLKCLDTWRLRRNELASVYMELLEPLEEDDVVTRPYCRGEPAWYAFPIRLEKAKREQVEDHLKSVGIPTKRYYSEIVPKTGAYADHWDVWHVSKLENATRYAEETLCLPIHEFMTLEQVRYVVANIKKGLSNAG